MMNTQLASRILLTVLVLVPWSVGIFFLFEEVWLYGITLFVISSLILLWIWKPWNWFRKSS